MTVARLKEYVSRVTTEMDDLEAKMNMFLDELSPESRSTFVDDMVQEGLESYFKKLKPKLDDWERTVRDHLNKFRLHAVKQLATLPRGLYEYQERAAELNVENNMDVDEFIEELSSTSVARNVSGVPNISTLQEYDQTELDVKQMQEKMSQYFDLATKFMDHLRDAQRVVAKLRIDDSVKELHVKALTQQKNEIVALASKFRRAADKRVDVYKERLQSTNRELERAYSRRIRPWRRRSDIS